MASRHEATITASIDWRPFSDQYTSSRFSQRANSSRVRPIPMPNAMATNSIQGLSISVVMPR